MISAYEIAYNKFLKITGVDVYQFLSDFTDFITNNVDEIYSFYNGRLSYHPSTSLLILNSLKERVNILIALFHANKKAFQNIAFWDILYQVEEVKEKLKTVSNISKYLRSSIINESYQKGTQKQDFMLSQEQTLENVSSDILKSNNKDNDWAEIATQNDLREEDYGLNGNIILKISYKNPGTINRIESVIDNIVGEKIYGRDFQKILEFEENDLKILGYKETLNQSVDTLMNLKKRDNPEFNDHGRSSIIGNSFLAISYPILFRQLMSVFATDDTIFSFMIVDIKRVGDSISIILEIETVYNDVLERNLTL